MKPRTYQILERAVEEGIGYGYLRAHKHTDAPEEEALKQHIHDAVMAAID